MELLKVFRDLGTEATGGTQNEKRELRSCDQPSDEEIADAHLMEKPEVYDRRVTKEALTTGASPKYKFN